MIYNSFVAVIDGPDASGKGTILNELDNNLYHRSPDEPKSLIQIFSTRPATRLATVDKDKTNKYKDNMYEYMDAFLLGRLCSNSLTAKTFLSETIRMPNVKIYDRGLLSTFFYAYVHDDGGYDYAKKIKELDKPTITTTSKSKKTTTTIVPPATREEIVDRLIARYIKFESVIRDRLKVLLNSSEDKQIRFKHNCEDYYNDEKVHINHSGIDIGGLLEALHTDITIAICCDEKLSDKVVERRHSVMDDNNQYEQIFETNETFRKNVNLIYKFFMSWCLPKLDSMNYVNPFIGHIIKVYTSQTITAFMTGEVKRKRPIDTNRDIVNWWNYYLSANNFTTLRYKGHEQYSFQNYSTCLEDIII